MFFNLKILLEIMKFTSFHLVLIACKTNMQNSKKDQFHFLQIQVPFRCSTFGDYISTGIWILPLVNERQHDTSRILAHWQSNFGFPFFDLLWKHNLVEWRNRSFNQRYLEVNSNQGRFGTPHEISDTLTMAGCFVTEDFILQCSCTTLGYPPCPLLPLCGGTQTNDHLFLHCPYSAWIL